MPVDPTRASDSKRNLPLIIAARPSRRVSVRTARGQRDWYLCIDLKESRFNLTRIDGIDQIGGVRNAVYRDVIHPDLTREFPESRYPDRNVVAQSSRI